MQEKELVSKQTLGILLEISPRTIEGWVLKKKIPVIKLGGLNRFPLVEIRKWYNAKRVAPTN